MSDFQKKGRDLQILKSRKGEMKGDLGKEKEGTEKGERRWAGKVLKP